MTWRQHVYRFSQRANGPRPPVHRTGQRHPPAVRGVAGLLRRGALGGRGGTPLRLHPGQLPGPRPPVPPGSRTCLLHPPGQGASCRPQGRSPPRSDHRAAQAEPLDLRHQPRVARRGAPARPGRRLPGPQGRRVRPPPPTRRRRAPAGTPAHHGRRRRRPAARPDPAATANPLRRAVPVPPDLGLDPVRPHRPPGGAARDPA